MTTETKRTAAVQLITTTPRGDPDPDSRLRLGRWQGRTHGLGGFQSEDKIVLELDDAAS